MTSSSGSSHYSLPCPVPELCYQINKRNLHFNITSRKVCSTIVDRPSIDEENLRCCGSVDVSVDVYRWPVDYTYIMWTHLFIQGSWPKWPVDLIHHSLDFKILQNFDVTVLIKVCLHIVDGCRLTIDRCESMSIDYVWTQLYNRIE